MWKMLDEDQDSGHLAVRQECEQGWAGGTRGTVLVGWPSDEALVRKTS